jgi:hypothetical protein
MLIYYDGNYINVNNKGMIKEKDLSKVKDLNCYEINFTYTLRVFAKDKIEAVKTYHDFDEKNVIIPEFEVKKL